MPEGVFVAVGSVGVNVAVLCLGGEGVLGALGLDDVSLVGYPIPARVTDEDACQDPGEDEQREQGEDRWQHLVVPQERIHKPRSHVGYAPGDAP